MEYTLNEALDLFYDDDDALKMDGFDDCILGVGSIAGRLVLVYDGDKIVDALVASGMSEEEAREHKMFNIDGAYLGPGTPVILDVKVLDIKQ